MKYRNLFRYPRTKQELTANQDRNDPYVRGKRRRKFIPTAWDDQPIRRQRSWKKLRKTQYRENKDGFEWRSFFYDWRNPEERLVGHNVQRILDRKGIWYKRTPGYDGRRGVWLTWYGPEVLYGQ